MDLFHQISVWLFRLAITAAAVGVVYLYLNKPVSVPTDFPRCQPIGHTADGELVYSMDCEQLPGEPAAEAAPAAAGK